MAEETTGVVVAMITQLVVKYPNAEKAIKFYKDGLGAVEVTRFTVKLWDGPDDQPAIQSAILRLGSTYILISDEGVINLKLHPAPPGKCDNLKLLLETSDVEATVAKVVLAGGTATVGDRGVYETIKDPFDNVWILQATPS